MRCLAEQPGKRAGPRLKTHLEVASNHEARLRGLGRMLPLPGWGACVGRLGGEASRCVLGRGVLLRWVGLRAAWPDEDGGAIAEHFGDALGDFGGVVAAANDGVRAEGSRVLNHNLIGVAPR